MRIWHVKPELLNLQRVLGEHRELHPILTMMRRPRYRTHWIVQRWYPHLRWLQLRHELLVDEYTLRCHKGIRQPHKTPFVLTDAESISYLNPATSPAEVLRDLDDLWTRQRDYMEPMLKTYLATEPSPAHVLSRIAYDTDAWELDWHVEVVEAIERMLA